MELITTGYAGTMESNDIMITVEPSDQDGVQVELTSSVYQQFGKQIIAVIRETVASYGVENALITAVDKGALDCTVRARVSTALRKASSPQADIMAEPPLDTKGKVTPVSGSRSTEPNTFRQVWNTSKDPAAQAAMKPVSSPMSEAQRPAPSLSARWKMGEPTSTASRNSAAVKSTARWISTL